MLRTNYAAQYINLEACSFCLCRTVLESMEHRVPKLGSNFEPVYCNAQTHFLFLCDKFYNPIYCQASFEH